MRCEHPFKTTANGPTRPRVEGLTSLKSIDGYGRHFSRLADAALCRSRQFRALPITNLGWAGFVGAAALYAFAMIAIFIAVSVIGPVRSSLLSCAEPVVAAGFGVILLGEALTLIQIAGIALVVIALVGQLCGSRAQFENRRALSRSPGRSRRIPDQTIWRRVLRDRFPASAKQSQRPRRRRPIADVPHTAPSPEIRA